MILSFRGEKQTIVSGTEQKKTAPSSLTQLRCHVTVGWFPLYPPGEARWLLPTARDKNCAGPPARIEALNDDKKAEIMFNAETQCAQDEIRPRGGMIVIGIDSSPAAHSNE